MASGERPSFHGIIGQSAPMQALYRLIERVAPTEARVLILGERGTGKELVATAAAAEPPERRAVRHDQLCGVLS